MVVFTNADFISLDEHDTTYSVMVVNGKHIAYMGYSIPDCYDNAKVIDLEGKAVIPSVNSLIEVNCKKAKCTKLAEGEQADFAVLDKNILKDSTAKVIEIYLHGRKKKI